MPWVCAYTSPRAESRAVEDILDLGHDAYSPMRTVQVTRARRTFTAQRPLFGGYIFAELGPNLEGLYAVRAVDGISQIIGGYSPAIVKQSLIDELRSAEAQGMFDERPKPEIAFKPGEPVRIMAGPFNGFVATVLRADPKRRVHVLLNMLGGTVTAQLDRKAVERA